MTAKRITLYCLAALAAGCVPIVSLNPLFTKEALVFDERLLGTWVADTNDPGETWELAHFEEDDDEGLPEELRGESKRMYRMNWTDREGHRGSCAACLVKLGDRRFLDIVPDRFPSGESDPNKMKLGLNTVFFFPCHMFLRVDTVGDQLKMGITHADGIAKLVETEPKGAAYATTDRGLVLTASTKELQALVTKYADDERLFVPITFVRKSK